ncbi:hypothetical protein GSU0275 [Geobacter sulfurreducens PCA]|jgi:hypothetical protein|uniref:Uncharacterized protein n=1 Tax=Geobacter sulfurreducens (strain ATCC 51573 / DSM 12127 / PCA) TaxID=243231 RepID=Q74GH1_GEOSL|nr:hypothetical protein GSU0275 [Geobacter sulfurreducens PCA]ADN78313.1 hypothetical protein KN400_3417 [Geobacter sulfurreducens KN400]AJY70003.1 hypothetical protein RW64_10600 [Geobacter sulfurreducens]HBB68380.1 hypothetical protein [Geobacter sulfurreducens]HCD97481.1 hypothetical protein [Geobacter sulfurreducens]
MRIRDGIRLNASMHEEIRRRTTSPDLWNRHHIMMAQHAAHTPDAAGFVTSAAQPAALP